MANVIYPLWKQALMDGSSDADLSGSGTTGLWVALVDEGTYTYSASHQYYSDLSGIVGTPVEITNVTVSTDGVVDGDNATFSAVTGATVEAIAMYRKNAGANTTWRLVAFMDTSITGFTLTPSGTDVQLTWNGSGIFKL